MAGIQLLEPPILTDVKSQESLAWLAVPKPQCLPLQLQSKATRQIFTGLGKKENLLGSLKKPLWDFGGNCSTEDISKEMVFYIKLFALSDQVNYRIVNAQENK